MTFTVINNDDFNLLVSEISRLKEVVENLKQPQPKEWVSEAEAMEILNVSKSTIQKFRKDGLLNWSQYKNLITYKYLDLMNFFEDHYTGNRHYVTSKLKAL